MRNRLITAFAVLLSLTLAGCGNKEKVACDRDCIIGATDTYLSALVAHNPGAAPLSENIAFVENITRMSPGE